MADDWSARIIRGDCIEAMEALDADSVHAVVCDPPYGLEFMGKEWDTFRMDDRSARWSSRSGEAGGFGEIPGGATLPNYGRRRTTSRCRTCGKRDAFRNPHGCDDDGTADWTIEYVDAVPVEMRAFQNWCHSWALEAYRVLKPGGHLLAFGGTRTYHRLAVALEDAGFDIRDSLHWIYGSGFPKSLDVSKQIDKVAGAEREVVDEYERSGRSGGILGAPTEIIRQVTEPATEAARRWNGWGTALKPAHEPVVMARKPLAENTVTANVLAQGTGALNIAATRVGTAGGTTGGPKNENWRAAGTNEQPSVVDIESIDAGRWPANVLLAHLPECEGVGPDHTAVLCAPGCPVAEINEMSGEAGGGFGTENRGASSGVFGDFSGDTKGRVVGFGDDGGAARFFYVAKPRKREKVGGTIRNLHPTVKPIELMRYLVRMVTPPGGVVLDPFLGSGTTGCAAMAEGLRFVGIERDEDSYATALARVSDWAFAHGRERPTAS